MAIFNTGSKSLEAVATMVKALVDEKEGLGASESQMILELRAAAARVKAGLATDQSLFIPTLEDGLRVIVSSFQEFFFHKIGYPVNIVQIKCGDT